MTTTTTHAFLINGERAISAHFDGLIWSLALTYGRDHRFATQEEADWLSVQDDNGIDADGDIFIQL